MADAGSGEKVTHVEIGLMFHFVMRENKKI